MSGQEKKCFLQRYRDCERAIARVEQELKRWETRAAQASAWAGLVPAPYGPEDGLTAIQEIAELKRELSDRLAAAAAVRREIARAIGAVEEERLRLLLEYRYIDAMTFERIAETMHYSWRQIANLHEKAIAAVVIA